MTYTPRAGSVGEQILAALQKHGGVMTRRQLADAMGQPIQNINRPLMMAVDGGGAIEHGAGRGKTAFSLPGYVPTDGDAPPAPKPKRGTAGRKAATKKRTPRLVLEHVPEPDEPCGCLYSDGDVGVFGALVMENDAVMLSDGLARRLHAFLERIYGPNE